MMDRIIELNRAWERITGYSLEEIPTLETGRRFPGTVCSARTTLEQIHHAGDGDAGEPHLNYLFERKTVSTGAGYFIRRP